MDEKDLIFNCGSCLRREEDEYAEAQKARDTISEIEKRRAGRRKAEKKSLGYDPSSKRSVASHHIKRLGRLARGGL